MKSHPVITGVGLVTCHGLDVAATWRAVLASRDGFAAMDAMEQPVPPGVGEGGQAPPLPEDYEPGLPREARYLRWAIQAALRDAGCEPVDGRAAVMLGTTLHGIRAGGRFLRSGDAGELRDFLAGDTLRLAVAGLGLNGPTATTCSACSSSLGSVALAVTMLEAGEADLVVCGGYDTVSEYVWGGFHSLRVVADGPPMPFCRDRPGMKLAEGYGVLVLEPADDAGRRGAKPLAVVSGWGESADAHHLTKPDPAGGGAARAMRAALDRAGLQPGDIGLNVAHATGTPDNDAAEFAALSSVFGDRLADVPTVAFKSHLGHTLGGAGAIELILAAIALRDGIVPATARVSPEQVEFPGLNVATGRPRRESVDHALSSSFGFGGANTSVVISRPDAAAAAADVQDVGRDVRQGERNVRQGERDVRQGERDVRQGGRDLRQGGRDLRQGGRDLRQGGRDLRQGERDVRQGETDVRDDDPRANGGVPGANGADPRANGADPRANGADPRANGDDPRANGDDPGANGTDPGANGGVPGANGGDLDAGRSVEEVDVAVVGVGVVLPEAIGNAAFLRSLREGGPVPGDLDPAGLGDLVDARRTRRMSAYVKFTLAAARLALDHAGLLDSPLLRDTGAILGTTHGSPGYCYDYYKKVVDGGVLAANPMLFAEGVPNAAAAQLSLAFGLGGACQTILGTRTAGLDALRLAATRVRLGHADRVIVTAAEERHPSVDLAYEHCGRDSSDHRAGGVCLVIERRDSAEERGARVLATLGPAAAFNDGPAGLRRATRRLDEWRRACADTRATTFRSCEPADGRTRPEGRGTGAVPRDRLGEVFSVGPLLDVAAAALNGLEVSGSARDAGGPASVAVCCTDPAGPVAAVVVRPGEA